MPLPKIHHLAVVKEWRLIDLSTKETFYYGQRVATFDGRIGTLEFATPPEHDMEPGVVHFRQDNTGHMIELPPAVIGARWMDGEELF